MNHDGWAIEGPDGELRKNTVRRTRTDCIAGFGGETLSHHGRWWALMRLDGYRCVKVKLTEVK